MLDGIEVRFGQPVMRVEPSAGQVQTRTSRETLTADAVVVAVPLPLVQAGQPGIVDLPIRVSRALRGLTTGNLEKVILRNDEQWWGDSQVVGFPALVGFSGGQAARTRPASDSACAAEAQARLTSAFRR